MTEQQKQSLSQEFNGLNLTRFIQEAVCYYAFENVEVFEKLDVQSYVPCVLSVLNSY